MHHARATLRELGYRLTPQRLQVWEALRSRPGEHLTAEEIAGVVHATLPEVNLSTVYRTLDLLVDLHLVTETSLGTTHRYYEVEDGRPHHHLVCDRCHGVSHVDDTLFAPVYCAIEQTGFSPSHMHATVYGLCADCQHLQTEETAEALRRAEEGDRAHP